jgi:hypothetical protein
MNTAQSSIPKEQSDAIIAMLAGVPFRNLVRVVSGKRDVALMEAAGMQERFKCENKPHYEFSAADKFMEAHKYGCFLEVCREMVAIAGKDGENFTLPKFSETPYDELITPQPT